MDDDIVHRHMTDKMPPPLEQFSVPVEAWKTLEREKILEEKIQQLQREESIRKWNLRQNQDVYEKEALRLISEINSNYNPVDRWQYRKGLRLMFLGTTLGNDHYKTEGRKFYLLTCSNDSK